jgi:hypothetical protein
VTPPLPDPRIRYVRMSWYQDGHRSRRKFRPSRRSKPELHPSQNRLLPPMSVRPSQSSPQMGQHAEHCERSPTPNHDFPTHDREYPRTKVAATEIEGKDCRSPFLYPCPRPSSFQLVPWRSRVSIIHRYQVQRCRPWQPRQSARKSSNVQSVSSDQSQVVGSGLALTFSVTTLSNVSSVNSVEICLPRWAHQPVL